MSIISATKLRKLYDHEVVLDAVSLTVEPGERIGVVGNNGCGKSTMGRLLAGLEQPDAGTIAVQRGAEIAYLAQQPRFVPGESVRQAVLSGLHRWSAAHARYQRAVEGLEGGSDTDYWLSEQAAASEQVEHTGGWDRLHQAEAILGRLGVDDIEAPVDTLSGGRRRAVALARVLLAAPELAILDEPTNHLDISTIEWLEEFLSESYRGALILITHDRYVLDRVVTRTAEIDGAALFSYDGGYRAYLEAKADRLALSERIESNRQNFLRGELEWLRRSPKARSVKQKARVQRANAAIGRAAPKAEKVAEFRASASRSGKSILEAEELGIDVAGTTLLRDCSLRLLPGERIGIVGPNGCGKTTLLRVLLGLDSPAAGTVNLGHNTRVAYLDQSRSGLDDAASVENNIAGDRGYFRIGEEMITVRSYLGRFLFDTDAARRVVGTLSGGERARVALAKMLASEANLIVLDEPTNDLDVATLGALETMISQFTGTALMVSHDRWFLDRLATSILAFSEDGCVERFVGNYSEYREKTDAAKRAVLSKPDRSSRRTPSTNTPPKAKRLTYAERIELEALMDRVDAAETRVAELEAQLADPQLYAAGGERVKTLLADLDDAKASAQALSSRWEELESKQ